ERVLLVRHGHTSPNGHPLSEEALVVGPRDEVAPHAAHAPEARRHRCEDVLERPAPWPPELVAVGVDHPIGAEVRRCKARHARCTADLRKVTVWIADQMD